jgi:predicted RNA-binding protein YlqC (UPF0109 family)
MDTETAINEALALVAAMVFALVDHPAKVKISAEHGEATTIHVTTDPLDTGKLVGKQGRNVRSMRTILYGNSMRVHHRFNLNIVETERIGNAERY